MLILLIILAITTIIFSCFHKRNTWEYRLNIILISLSASIIMNTTVTYLIRDELPNKIVVDDTKKISSFYVEDSIFIDKTRVIKKSINKIIFSDYPDSLLNPLKVNMLIFNDSTNNINLAYYIYGDDNLTIKNINQFKFTTDTVPNISSNRIVYDVSDNIWIDINVYSDIYTYELLKLPDEEFNLIPDSIRYEFNLNEFKL